MSVGNSSPASAMSVCIFCLWHTAGPDIVRLAMASSDNTVQMKDLPHGCPERSLSGSLLVSPRFFLLTPQMDVAKGASHEVHFWLLSILISYIKNAFMYYEYNERNLW